MKKILKYGLIAFLAINVLIIVGGVFFGDEEISDSIENQEKKEIVIKDWKILTFDEKKQMINLFINGKEKPHSENLFRFRLLLLESIPKFVKYPETLEFQDLYENNSWVSQDNLSAKLTHHSLFQVVNYDEGILEINVPFRSESKIGLKIRSNVYMQFKYNGTSNFTILKAKVD